MSPSDIRDKAIDLSGNTRVTLHIYTLISVGCVLLGIRYLPDEAADSKSDLLIYKMDTMLLNQSGLSQVIHQLELEVNTHKGMINRNKEDIDKLQNVLNRSTTWPGTIGSD